MASPQHWITYDARDRRRGYGTSRRRKWPWFLLLLLLVAALLTAGWFWYDSSDGVDFTQPVAIQAALPALLTDDVMVVYVVDDSGSMSDKLSPLRQALQEVADKPTENSEIALLMFGDTNRVLFDFTEPDDAPWDDAIPSFSAASGGTAMFLALQEALEMLPDAAVCTEKSRFIFFGETVCRQNRIVLMSDGMANDILQIRNITNTSMMSASQEAELMEAQAEFEATVIDVLVASNVPVDTIALGVDADEEGLRFISDATDGRFMDAYY